MMGRGKGAAGLRPPGQRHHPDWQLLRPRLGCLADGWEAKGLNAPLVKALQSLLRDSPIHWDITWIPGHAGVLGNEAPDGAASRGARASRAGRALSDLDLRIRN